MSDKPRQGGFAPKVELGLEPHLLPGATGDLSGGALEPGFVSKVLAFLTTEGHVSGLMHDSLLKEKGFGDWENSARLRVGRALAALAARYGSLCRTIYTLTF